MTWAAGGDRPTVPNQRLVVAILGVIAIVSLAGAITLGAFKLDSHDAWLACATATGILGGVARPHSSTDDTNVDNSVPGVSVISTGKTF